MRQLGAKMPNWLRAEEEESHGGKCGWPLKRRSFACVKAGGVPVSVVRTRGNYDARIFLEMQSFGEWKASPGFFAYSSSFCHPTLLGSSCSTSLKAWLPGSLIFQPPRLMHWDAATVEGGNLRGV